MGLVWSRQGLRGGVRGKVGGRNGRAILGMGSLYTILCLELPDLYQFCYPYYQ